MGNNNGAYSNAQSNSTVKWLLKMEHSAFKAVVTRVTLPYFCDSRYICDSRYVVQDYGFGVKRPGMCNSVTKKEENNNFQCQLSKIISVRRKIHISVTRVTLPYQLMFGIIP